MELKWIRHQTKIKMKFFDRFFLKKKNKGLSDFLKRSTCQAPFYRPMYC